MKRKIQGKGLVQAPLTLFLKGNSPTVKRKRDPLAGDAGAMQHPAAVTPLIGAARPAQCEAAQRLQPFNSTTQRSPSPTDRAQCGTWQPRQQRLPAADAGCHISLLVACADPKGAGASSFASQPRACTGSEDRQEPVRQASSDCAYAAPGVRQQAAAQDNNAEAAAPLEVALPDSGAAGLTGELAGRSCGPAGKCGLNAYEAERDERIRRNQEVMRAMLGAAAVVAPQPPPRAPRPRRCAQPPRKPAADLHRRSTRSRGPPQEAGCYAATAEAKAGGAARTDELETYDDSTVRRYICMRWAGEAADCDAPWASFSEARSDAGEPGGDLTGFRRMPLRFVDVQLARILDAACGLLAAGGKDGRVAVWGLGSARVQRAGRGADTEEQAVQPLLSARLHSGWVSDVQLVRRDGAASASPGDPECSLNPMESPSSGTRCAERAGSGARAGCSGRGITGTGSVGTAGGMACAGTEGTPEEEACLKTAGAVPLLLTASNDGAVAVWDLAQTAVGGRSCGEAHELPRRVTLATDLHEGGIFSMHVRGRAVLTASKDGSVAVSELGGDGGIRLLRRWGDHHAGVAKCARWRGSAPHVFASCGNDRCIRVTDARKPGAAAAACLQDAHGAAINCLRWHPAAEHQLLSAAAEPAAHLWDLRAPGRPLHALVGHIGSRGGAQIYQPQFVGGGGWVATGGQGSRQLWLYDCATGRAVSHGDIGFDPAATLSGAGRAGVFAAATARSVAMFAPEFHTFGGA